MEEHNGIKFGIFIFIVLVFLIGGFILMRKSFNIGTDNKVTESSEKTKRKDIRIDKNRDYIYFSDYEMYE